PTVMLSASPYQHNHFVNTYTPHRDLPSFPTRRSSDLQRDRNIEALRQLQQLLGQHSPGLELPHLTSRSWREASQAVRSAEQQPEADLNRLLARDWSDLTPMDRGLAPVRAQQHSPNQLAAHPQPPLAEAHSLQQQARDRIDLSRQDSGVDAIRAQPHRHKQLAAQLQQPPAEGISPLQEVDRLSQERSASLAQTERQIALVEHQIKGLQASRVSYPGYVEDALRAIRQQCPGADPRVLCDHVEVLDADWQMAIEGYIGGSRF